MADFAKVTVAKDALSSLQESINIGKLRGVPQVTALWNIPNRLD